MTENTLLTYMLDRLSSSKDGQAVFTADEIENWPSGLLNTFQKTGLLQSMQPAKVIECSGCEESCFMPVHIFPTENNIPARAFIACDKRNDMGRIPVAFSRLALWQTTSELFANVLSRLLGFNEIKPILLNEHQWKIGMFEGKKNKSLMILSAKNVFNLSFAGHVIPLGEVLNIKESVLFLDKSKLIRLVDKPTGANEKLEDRDKWLLARVKEEKAKGTKAFLRVVAEEAGISKSRLKQIIAKEKRSASLRRSFPRIDD